MSEIKFQLVNKSVRINHDEFSGINYNDDRTVFEITSNSKVLARFILREDAQQYLSKMVAKCEK